LREREQGLLSKIDAALDKIEEGVYGQCTNCGEDIGVKRLKARPVAELCIECKSEQEKIERRTG
jgi:DnaK suppressor protein